MRAIFLDRDGVINPIIYHEDHGILDSPLCPDDFELFPQALEAIRLINEAGIPAVVVSNQPAVAKGKIGWETFLKIDKKMKDEIAAAGGRLAGVYYCLHHPDAVEPRLRVNCACRKPKPGLLRQAATKHRFDLRQSFMIGDGLTDIEAGKSVGCCSILVGYAKCDSCRKFDEHGVRPDHIAKDLLAATKFILRGTNADIY